MVSNSKINVRKLVQLALLAAIGLVLMYFIRFPIIPAAPYLIYDPADIPIILAAFLFGPLSGLALTFIVSVIQGIALSSDGFVGAFMHFCATGSYCLLAGLIYKRKRDMAGAVIALAAGVCVMSLLMILLNIVIQPLYYGLPVKAVTDIILPVLLPFNLIKAGVNSAIAFIVFKSAGPLLTRMAEK